MATAGRGVIIESGKRGVLPSGKLAIFNSAGACPCCCGGYLTMDPISGRDYWNHAWVEDRYVARVWDDNLHDYVSNGASPDWAGLWSAAWSRLIGGSQDIPDPPQHVAWQWRPSGPDWDDEEHDIIAGDLGGNSVLREFDVSETALQYDAATQEPYDISLRIPVSIVHLNVWDELKVAVRLMDSAPSGDSLVTAVAAGTQYHAETVSGSSRYPDVATEFVISLTAAQLVTATESLFVLTHPQLVDPGNPGGVTAWAQVIEMPYLMWRVRDK